MIRTSLMLPHRGVCYALLMTNEAGTKRDYLSTRAILFYNINQLIDAFAINNDANEKWRPSCIWLVARREKRKIGAGLWAIVTLCTDLLPEKATRNVPAGQSQHNLSFITRGGACRRVQNSESEFRTERRDRIDECNKEAISTSCRRWCWSASTTKYLTWHYSPNGVYKLFRTIISYHDASY